MVSYLILVLNLFCDLLELAIIVRVVMSWFVVAGRSQGSSRFKYFIDDVTDPIMKLATKITPRVGMIDFSPMVAFFGLELLRIIITNLLIAI